MMAAAPASRPEASAIAAHTTQLLRLAERITQVSLCNQSARQGPRYRLEVFDLCSLAIVGIHFQLKGGSAQEIALWRARARAVIQTAETELQCVQPEGLLTTLPILEPHPLMTALPPIPSLGRLFAEEGNAHGQ
jgi:hypothetical protein